MMMTTMMILASVVDAVVCCSSDAMLERWSSCLGRLCSASSRAPARWSVRSSMICCNARCLASAAYSCRPVCVYQIPNKCIKFRNKWRKQQHQRAEQYLPARRRGGGVSVGSSCVCRSSGRLSGSMLQVMPLILHYPVHSACHRLRLAEARQQQTTETVRDFVCSPHMLASECFCQVV